MPKYVVDVVESDDFAWGSKLEERMVFDSLEAAQKYQQQYNNEEHESSESGNVVYARAPYELKEDGNG